MNLLKTTVSQQITAPAIKAGGFKPKAMIHTQPKTTRGPAPSADIGDGGGSVETLDQIANLEALMGSLEMQIGVARLRTDPEGKKLLSKLMSKRAAVLLIWRNANSRKMAQKGGGNKMQLLPGQNSQQKQQEEMQEQQEQKKEQQLEKETDDKKSKIRELQAKATKLELEASLAPPTQKKALYDRAYEARQKASGLEELARHKEKQKRSGPTFRPSKM
jgi:hypothetical protein